MTVLTIAEAVERTGVEVLDHLDRQAEIPLCSGLVRQGDVIVIPVALLGRNATAEAQTTVPAEGYPVVKGEATANTHLLLADGDVRFDPRTPSPTDLTLGVLTVGERATAYLAHPEHAFTRIAPGTYEVRRQREMAEELRMVAD